MKMKKLLTIIIFAIIFIACSSNTEKDRVTKLLKDKIGDQLPFKEVKIANVENGIGVIVDDFWCYWIDSNNTIYCVNGISKTIYNTNNPTCVDAPINSTYFDIKKIAQ